MNNYIGAEKLSTASRGQHLSTHDLLEKEEEHHEKQVHYI